MPVFIFVGFIDFMSGVMGLNLSSNNISNQIKTVSWKILIQFPKKNVKSETLCASKQCP